MKSSFKTIIGNEKIINNIKKAIKEKTDSHAYLIISEDKVARREIAFAMAKAMLCEKFDSNLDVCDECKSCKAFNSSNNPDFKVITKDTGKKDKKGPTDIIRDEIVKDANYMPTNFKYKIYVIDEAEFMNDNAQNALLKTLEEPNEYVKIFILADNEEALLTTILSRCITLKLSALNAGDLKKWAYRNFDPVTDKEALEKLDYYVYYADGKISSLLNIASNPEFQILREKTLEISEILLSKKFEDFCICKNLFNDEKDSIDDILNILEIWYRDVLFVKNNLEDKVINIDKIEKLKSIARKVNEQKINNAIKSIKTYKMDLKDGANFKIATEVFQINVSEV